MALIRPHWRWSLPLRIPSAACSIDGRTPGRLFAGGRIRVDLAHRAQPALSISEDEQLIAKLFERAEVADTREPRGTALRDREAETAPDLAEQHVARGFSSLLQSLLQSLLATLLPTLFESFLLPLIGLAFEIFCQHLIDLD